jgi:diguanylate cyclase (GGDEF)-like protein
MRRKRPVPTDPAELRREAERALHERGKEGAPPATTEDDPRRLVQELQVHQIELEMQNEELARSRAEIEELLRQYTDLYDFAPVGYLTLARDGSIQQANLAGAHLLGVERGALIKRRLGTSVASNLYSTFNTFLARAFANLQKETCEVALQREWFAPLWVQIAAISEDGEECRVVMMDITERRRVEEELKHLSTHDALTGLYSRGFFMEEMARLERGRNFPVSIVMADVDNLKKTNDVQGHAAGDALLVRVAKVLNDAFRLEDVVGRIGGDEFAVLLPGTGAAAAKASLARVRQVIHEDNVAHEQAPIRLSLGVSTAETPGTFSLVFKEADENMYREKRARERT